YCRQARIDLPALWRATDLRLLAAIRADEAQVVQALEHVVGVACVRALAKCPAPDVLTRHGCRALLLQPSRDPPHPPLMIRRQRAIEHRAGMRAKIAGPQRGGGLDLIAADMARQTRSAAARPGEKLERAGQARHHRAALGQPGGLQAIALAQLVMQAGEETVEGFDTVTVERKHQ